MSAAQLYFTASIEEQWQTLVGPWLREQAATAWKDRRPTVILTPSRTEGFYLRSRLVGEGTNFLGLRFWTPSDFRTFLTGELLSNVRTVSEPELRLIARLAAETLLKKSPVNDATLASTAQEPDPFKRAYDLLLSAGWDLARDGAPYGRKLAAEMQRLLDTNHLATQAGIHLHLRKSLASAPQFLLANLLVTGFSATHWPLWDLLQAAVCSAEQATIAFSHPRSFGQSVDQLWISSWEEVLKVVVEIPEGPSIESSPAFAKLSESYEDGVPCDARESDLSFLVAPDLATQVDAVVLQAIDYLKSDSCTRLGIVFPEANALSLEVAGQLTNLGIPIDDGTGAIKPGIFECRAWTTWIDLQQEPSVGKLNAWLRACESQKLDSGLGDLSAQDATNLLDGALGETLVDDLDFLGRYLEENSQRRNTGKLTDFLRQRIALPPTATFAEFFMRTLQMLTGAGWKNHHAPLEAEAPKWLLESKEVLSRRTFLGWLKESTDSRESTRGGGNHFYGKVHLLIYSRMTGQTWSHLILTGLNEGVWPRVYESEAFGSRHELAALNQAARGLNRVGTAQGSQGLGHEIVLPDHGHCLLPLERLDLSLRDLCATLEATTEAVCVSAMTTEVGRSLLPSDFFNHAYHAKTGCLLDEEIFRHLASQTAAWCDKHAPLFQTKSIVSPEIAATRIAYEARRDITRPFGPYEFSYANPPERPIQLSCKTWEEAWTHPSSVWLEEIVGVSAWPEGQLSWPRAVGTWVHRWLALVLRECQEKKSLDNFLPSLRAIAKAEAVRVQNCAKASNLPLYPWWEQVWGQAESITLGLGESLIPVLQGKTFLSEFRLPENIRVALPTSEAADFALTGRMDLLVIEPGTKPCDPANSDFTGCACWVIDFKTGNAPSLNAKKVGEGTGLQAVLYALSARARGANSVAISLHTFTTPLKEQVQLDNALAMTDLFRSLDTLHRTGVFGMRNDAQNEYGFSPAYPMATRFISPDILNAKWVLVHGTNPGDQEENE